jgi:hypothetical protein
LTIVAWRQSSYSNIDGGECVEVAGGYRDVGPVRDFEVPEGPAVGFGAGVWSAFAAGVKGGNFPAA